MKAINGKAKLINKKGEKKKRQSTERTIKRIKKKVIRREQQCIWEKNSEKIVKRQSTGKHNKKGQGKQR